MGAIFWGTSTSVTRVNHSTLVTNFFFWLGLDSSHVEKIGDSTVKTEKNKISFLEFDINDLEQYGRKQNLEIQGIPMSNNENNSETESKVLTVLKKIDENTSHHDIDIAHRLGKSKTNKTSNIIVRFVSRRTRNNIYKERRKLKSNAPGNLPLNAFSSMKTLQKEINIYFAWPMKKEKNLTGNTFGPNPNEISALLPIWKFTNDEAFIPSFWYDEWSTCLLIISFLLIWCVVTFHLLGVLYLIYFSIYSIIMALCKTCEMPNCLHCAHCSSCHKYIQSPNDSRCYSNQQPPKTSASFTCSACVSSTVPFFNLTNTELYNLLSFDDTDLSNFIESFPCDLSAKNI